MPKVQAADPPLISQAKGQNTNWFPRQSRDGVDRAICFFGERRWDGALHFFLVCGY